MMMINSPSDGGELLNCLNSCGVRVRSKVKIPLKNKVNFINTTNPPRARHSFRCYERISAAMSFYYVHGPRSQRRARNNIIYVVRGRHAHMPGASAPRAFTVICNKKNTYCF